ncbi:MAG TPA: amino acid racemase [Thermoanaerobaculia bacterium]|nr:amino acid racemase [Thermoanaerobaculia bacterium]
MRTIGIIGGIGPESTIDYYRLLIEAYRSRVADGSYPSIVINSIDVAKVLGFVANDLGALTAYLSREVQRLADAGADFAALAANTPHVVFGEVQRASSIPLVSIVRAAHDGAVRRGLTRLALFGTRFTMGGSFYPDVFRDGTITLVPPRADEQEFIHDKCVNELLQGEFLDETRRQFERIIVRLRDEERIDGVILAGTELPLLLRTAAIEGVAMLDTTRLHVDAILDAFLR